MRGEAYGEKFTGTHGHMLKGEKTWVGKNIGFYIFSFGDESDIVVVLVSPVGSSPRAAENDETERQLATAEMSLSLSS